MTTSYDIIASSLRMLGVVASEESLSAAEAADGLAALNDLVHSWGVASMLSVSWPQVSKALTAGKVSYTIGSGGEIDTVRPSGILSAYITYGGVDYPLQSMSFVEYQNLAVKTSTGIPEVIVYSPGSPLATLLLYPVPSAAGMTLVIDKIAPITDLTLHDDLPYPPEYNRALRYNLAVDLAPEYGVDVPPAVAMVARQSKSAVARNNLQVPTAPIDPLLQRRMGGGLAALLKG